MLLTRTSTADVGRLALLSRSWSRTRDGLVIEYPTGLPAFISGYFLARQAMGLQGALDIYLTDSTFSTAACVKAGYLHGIQASFRSEPCLCRAGEHRGDEAGSLEAGETPGAISAGHAHRRRAPKKSAPEMCAGIKPELDVERFALEVHLSEYTLQKVKHCQSFFMLA